MKRICEVLMVLSVIVCLMTGCGRYESTSECELLTIRLIEEKHETGTFTTKTSLNIYAEISYKLNDEIVTEIIDEFDINVGEETKVVLEEGYSYPKVYLTVDDYKKLYELN